jgi:hypothetical protein
MSLIPLTQLEFLRQFDFIMKTNQSFKTLFNIWNVKKPLNFIQRKQIIEIYN